MKAEYVAFKKNHTWDWYHETQSKMSWTANSYITLNEKQTVL